MAIGKTGLGWYLAVKGPQSWWTRHKLTPWQRFGSDKCSFPSLCSDVSLLVKRAVTTNNNKALISWESVENKGASTLIDELPRTSGQGLANGRAPTSNGSLQNSQLLVKLQLFSLTQSAIWFVQLHSGKQQQGGREMAVHQAFTTKSF